MNITSPQLTQALAHASKEFGLTLTTRIIRKRGYSQQRFYVSAYLLNCRTKKYSLTMIANIYGLTNHTAIMYQRNRAYELWGKAHFEQLTEVDANPDLEQRAMA